jgi:hypothetical protein
MWVQDMRGSWDCNYPDACFGHVSNGTAIAMWALLDANGNEIASGHVTRKGRTVDQMQQEAVDCVTKAWKGR